MMLMTTQMKEGMKGKSSSKFLNFFPHVISHVGNVIEFMDSDGGAVQRLLSVPHF